MTGSPIKALFAAAFAAALAASTSAHAGVGGSPAAAYPQTLTTDDMLRLQRDPPPNPPVKRHKAHSGNAGLPWSGRSSNPH